ncbi:MAG: S8 family serine peptidase, partial [Candidatus Thermoplasmatota archaeon]
ASLGGEVTYRSPILNLLVARLPPEGVAALRDHPAVASVEPEGTLDVLLDISVPATGAPTFWAGGYTGGPFELIVADTGIDGTHPALSGKVSDAQTFHDAGRFQAGYTDDWTTTDDLHGHGTHIGGNIASQDASLRGMAYGLFGVVNVKFGWRCNLWPGCGRGEWSDAWKGIDWGILTAGGDVLSFSFGGGANNDGTDAMSLYMDAVVDDLGIPVAVAAGNSGPGAGSLGQPAAAYNILTVGALDDRATVIRSDDVIAGFSSRGPTSDGRLKPDISAPGSDIQSTAHDWEGVASDWTLMSGTSMATPHVAGGVELAMHASGGIAFPARAKALLLNSAQDLGSAGADTTYGWGSMNLNDAWTFRNFVVEGNTTPASRAWFTLSGGAGDRATMVWQKHVIYNYAAQPNPGAWQSWSLNNLDLALYDEIPQTRLALANRLRDNVEQVSFASATSGVLKVWVVGSLNGVAQEHFAIAGESALTPVAGPALSMTLSAPPSASAGQNFVVTANLTNTGGLRVGTSTATLTMPPGV